MHAGAVEGGDTVNGMYIQIGVSSSNLRTMGRNEDPVSRIGIS